MNEKTLEALKTSIEHWRRMANGKPKRGEEPGYPGCALCNLFRKEVSEPHYDIVCTGCPVAERTGVPACEDTPYDDAQEAFDDYGIDSEEFKEAAQYELEFIESLLPAVIMR